MKIIIETTDNGVILREGDGLDARDLSYDFEDESGDLDIPKQATVLRAIIDLLGWNGSRYDKERLYVEVRPGDKA